MTTIATPLAEQLAEAAHCSDDPSVSIEDREYDILAFEFWHLGSDPDVQLDEWKEDEGAVARRARCL